MECGNLKGVMNMKFDTKTIKGVGCKHNKQKLGGIMTLNCCTCEHSQQQTQQVQQNQPRQMISNTRERILYDDSEEDDN